MTSIHNSKAGLEVKVELLDVRTEEEWNEKHIEGSTLMNFKNPLFPLLVAQLDKAKNYEVYCRSGARAESAVKLMKDLGFGNVQNVGTVEDVLKRSTSRCIGQDCK